MYADTNFKSKKQFKEAITNGKVVRLYAPGMGEPKLDGKEYVEGPHYPEPHKWYAEVIVRDGVVVSVK